MAVEQRRFVLTQYGTNKTIEIRAFEVREGYFQIASIKETDNVQSPIDVTSALGLKVGDSFIESDLTDFATSQGYQYSNFTQTTGTSTEVGGLNAPTNLEASQGAPASGDIDLTWENNTNLAGTPSRAKRTLIITGIGTITDTIKIEAKNGDKIFETILPLHTFTATLASLTATRDFVLALLNVNADLESKGWKFTTNGVDSIDIESPESLDGAPVTNSWTITITKAGTVAATAGVMQAQPETDLSIDYSTNPDFTGMNSYQDSTPGLTSFTLPGLVSGTVYYIRVRLERNGTGAAKSNVVMITAP